MNTQTKMKNQTDSQKINFSSNNIDMENIKKELELKKDIIETVQIRMIKAQNELDDLQNELEDLENELEDLENEVEDLEEEFETMKKERENKILKKTVQTQEEQIKELMKQLKEQSEQIELLKQKPQQIVIEDADEFNNLYCINENLTDKKNQNKQYTSKGIDYKKKAGKWRLRITENGKQKHIGYYSTEEEAHEAYLNYNN